MILVVWLCVHVRHLQACNPSEPYPATVPLWNLQLPLNAPRLAFVAGGEAQSLQLDLLQLCAPRNSKHQRIVAFTSGIVHSRSMTEDCIDPEKRSHVESRPKMPSFRKIWTTQNMFSHFFAMPFSVWMIFECFAQWPVKQAIKARRIDRTRHNYGFMFANCLQLFACWWYLVALLCHVGFAMLGSEANRCHDQMTELYMGVRP